MSFLLSPALEDTGLLFNRAVFLKLAIVRSELTESLTSIYENCSPSLNGPTKYVYRVLSGLVKKHISYGIKKFDRITNTCPL